MTAITQGFLDPKVRDWLYTVALAVGPLLIGKEAMAEKDWELWLALVGSILVPGVARMNIDYSLGGRAKGKRELGREKEWPWPMVLDPGNAAKVTPLPEASMTLISPRLEKVLAELRDGQQALADQLSRWEVAEVNLADPGPEEPAASEEVAGEQFAQDLGPRSEDGEPEVVYDAVRRAQEMQVDRLADDPRQDPTVPPEHRP
jgi:hypothetical protein